MSIDNLSERSLAALQQMGIRPVIVRKEKAEIALLGAPEGVLEQQWLQDLLKCIGRDISECVLADSEQAQPAKRYWVFGKNLPATATHLYLPSDSLNTDEKRRLWRSMQRCQ